MSNDFHAKHSLPTPVKGKLIGDVSLSAAVVVDVVHQATPSILTVPGQRIKEKSKFFCVRTTTESKTEYLYSKNNHTKSEFGNNLWPKCKCCGHRMDYGKNVLLATMRNV